MKIAIFTDNFRLDMGGGTKVVYDTARGLKDLGHEVLIVTGRSVDDSLKKEFRVFNLPSFRYPFYDKAEFVLPSLDLIREVERFTPDVIHYHEPFTAGMVAVMVGRYVKKPVVGTVHVDPMHISYHSVKFDNGKIAKLLVGFMAKQSDAIVFVSKYQLETYRPFLPENVFLKVIYPGIPDFFFSSRKASFGKRVITVTRLAPEKNLEFGLRVISKVQRVVDFEYFVVGEGSERKKLEELAEKLNVRVKFLGKVKREKLAELYSSSSIFFLPSKYETFGLVFAEAMACGLPVVCLDSGSAPEVVGEAGFVCSENVSSVAESLKALLVDEKLWKRKSVLAKERAEKFRVVNSVKEHLNLYTELLS